MNGYKLLKRNQKYRNVFLALVGSQFGDWFNQVALAQVTLELTHSASAMGIVLLCRALPSVFLGPILSPLIDFYPKRNLLYLSDLVRACLALGYCIGVLCHAFWILAMNACLLSLAGVFFSPARKAVIPFFVTKDELSVTNTLESSLSGFMQIVGSIAGGMVASMVSPILCFCVNSASYIWSVSCLIRTKWQDPAVQGKRKEGYMDSLKEGFIEANQNKVVKAILLIGISWGLAGGGYYILLPVIGMQTFHAGAWGIGLLYVMDGLGVVIGSTLVRIFIGSRVERAIRWYGVSYVTQAFFFALMTQVHVFILSLILLLCMRISSGVIIPVDSYLLQMYTNSDKRGRIFSLHQATYGGTMQVSYVLTGLAYDRMGVPITGILIGCMSLLCGAGWLWKFVIWNPVSGIPQEKCRTSS